MLFITMHFATYFFSIFKKHRMRYFACILGFGVALGAVFGVSAYSSVLDETVNRFYFVEENTFMLLGKGANVIQIIPFESEVPDNVSDYLMEQPGIVYTLPVIFKDFANSSQYKWLKNVIVGIDIESLQNFYLKDVGLQAGEWPAENSHEIVVGPNLEIDQLEIGMEITIREENFTVSGIANPFNVFFDKFLYLDYNLMQDLFNMDGFCSAMYVIGDPQFLTDNVYLQDLELDVENSFPSINMIDAEELDEASGFYYKILDAFNIVLGLFPLFISGLFIFILMLLNVKDQEREFGMLRALGMPLQNIGLIVFLQSLVITLVGYVVSLITGNFYFMYGYYVFHKNTEQRKLFSYVQDMMKEVPAAIYLQTLLLSVALGVIIAIYPSIRALRQSIVQTFRKEE